MARFKQSGESQATLPAGVPSGLTFNGYFAAVVAGASANYKLRRCHLGVRAGTGVPTSMQVTVGVYRQTTRAAGTGVANAAGQAMDPRSAATAVGGLDTTTAAAAGTTGPVVATNPMERLTFNTQSGYDVPWEMLEEWICDQGTANGIAFVNLNNALPASHVLTIDTEWEE